jgi:hypothetical protein
MNRVLSDEEIGEIQNREFSQNDWLWFYTRAIEAAVLAKFGEPVGYFYKGPNGEGWRQAHDPQFLLAHTPLYALKEHKHEA